MKRLDSALLLLMLAMTIAFAVYDVIHGKWFYLGMMTVASALNLFNVLRLLKPMKGTK